VRVFAATAINQDIKCNFEIIEAKWLAEQYIPEEYDSITD
jgi:MutT/NUDIX family protein